MKGRMSALVGLACREGMEDRMLFGNDKKKENASGIFVGPHGMTTNASGNVAIVRGSNGHDGMYTRAGNTIVGPHGRLYNIVGSGPSATIVGPHGKLYNVIENGSMTTIASSSGMHTVIHNNGGGGFVV